MSYNIHIKQNSNYEQVQNIYIKQNGIYTEINNAYVKSNGEYHILKQALLPIIEFDALNNTGNGLDTNTNTFVNIANNGIYNGTLEGWSSSNPKWENNHLAFSGGQKVTVDFDLFSIGEFTLQFYADDRNNRDPWRDYVCCYNTNQAAEPFKIERKGQNEIALYGISRFFGLQDSDAVISRANISTTDKFTYTLKCSQQKLTIFIHKGSNVANKAEVNLPNGINPNNYTTTKLILGRRYHLNTQSNGTTMNLYNFQLYNSLLTDTEILNNHQLNMNKYS